ncbi:MAG: SRPBCC family protein, partial [Woeseiaceae bacterium]|nr:SRPBCC family protein [Woeseiaceae bacterium]
MQRLTYAIGGIILLFFVGGLLLPREHAVTAETRIDAYPATVFALVNDFDRFVLWSPRFETDPNARIVYGGPDRGVGATMTWDGPVIGTGTQRIVRSDPYSLVEYAINPGAAGAARSTFEINADDGGTHVRWTHARDYGYNIVARYLAPLIAGIMEREQADGLRTLRELAETLPRIDFSDLEIERMVVDAMTIAFQPTSSHPAPGAISEAMGDAYFEILNFIDTYDLSEAGAPLSVMRSFSGPNLVFGHPLLDRGEALGAHEAELLGLGQSRLELLVVGVDQQRVLVDPHGA